MRLRILKALDPSAGVRNRGHAIFQSTHPKVKDAEDHFPINDADQARNALSRVEQFDSAPPWWDGSLEELKMAVRRAVHRAFSGIEVGGMEPMHKGYGDRDEKKAKRRLKNAKITHVSLVRRGRNKMPVVMKSTGRFEIETLTKAQGDLLHALVYVPENADTDGDVASREEVRKMAHDFLANGGNVDIEHNLQPLGPDQVRIAEHFIVQKGDPRFQGWTDYWGDPVDAEGSWAMIFKILDPELLGAAQRGELNGVSMFGHAEVEQLTKTATNSNPDEDEDHMKPEEIKELAQAVAESTAAAVVKAIKPEAPATPPAPKATEKVKPVFKGDPRDVKALAAFQEECLLASLDLSDPKDMATWQAHIAKTASKPDEGKPAEGGEAAELKAEIAALTARLDKVTKSSNAPAPEGNKDDKKDEKVLAGLTKGESSVWSESKKIAQALNKRNGYGQ